MVRKIMRIKSVNIYIYIYKYIFVTKRRKVLERSIPL